MQGHVEADERADALFHQDHATGEDAGESRSKGFSPRALRQDFTIEALLTRLWKARRTMGVANSDASSLLGGWSFRKDNLNRSLSHFVNLWDGVPTSIDRRNPEVPEIFFYQRRLTALNMGQVNVAEELLFSQAAGNGFTARCLPSMDRERPKPPADTSTTPTRPHSDTIADMRELVIRRRADQDANAELLRGVQRRPVIHPETDARDLLAAASARFDVLADAADNPHERGFWAPRPGTDDTLRRNSGPTSAPSRAGNPRPGSMCATPRAEAVMTWHGACALHPGRGRHDLARGTHQILRHPSSLGENHPAGQRDHHPWLREKRGQGAEGQRNHTSPRPSSPEWARPSSGPMQRSGNRS